MTGLAGVSRLKWRRWAVPWGRQRGRGLEPGVTEERPRPYPQGGQPGRKRRNRRPGPCHPNPQFGETEEPGSSGAPRLLEGMTLTM